MTKVIEFYIEDNDLDKLFEIKKAKGMKVTGNDFAKELLVNEIRRQHRNLPTKDDE